MLVACGTLVLIAMAGALPPVAATAASDAGAPSAEAGPTSADAGAEVHVDADANAVDANAPGLDATTVPGSFDAAPSHVGAGPPPAAASGPRVSLRGRVLEKGTRRPLARAPISIDGAPAGDTDGDGRFVVDVAPGRHIIRLDLPEHELFERWLEADATGAEQVLRLAPRDSAERYESTVRSSRVEVPQVNLRAEEARKMPGASGDPFRVIGSLPGVSQIFWPGAVYVIRGANPGNTGFFLDGVRVPALFHLALGPSVIHPYLVEGLDFHPGGFPAAYGGYVAGIVSARTQAPPTDRVHASADVTVYDAGGIVTAPWNNRRGTVAAAVRYSYTGALFSALSTGSVLRYGDYQLRVEHPLGGGQATVFAFGSLDQLGWEDTTAAGGSTYGALQFHRVDLRWRRGVGRGRLLVGLTLGVDWSRSTLFQRDIRVRALSAAPRLSYERELGAGFALEAGADALLQDFVSAVPDFQQRPSDLGRSRGAFTQGLFATLSFRAGPRLVIAPGLRGTFFAEEGTERLIAEPRLNVLVRASDGITVKLAGGRFAQMPSLPVSVPGFESFGLASLGVQTSLGASLGSEVRLSGDLTVGATGFAQQLRVTDIRDVDLSDPDPLAPSYLILRQGRSHGVELLVRRAATARLHGWLAYTLSWSRRQDDNGVFGRSDWDQRHILNLVGSYRLGRGYSAGARFHYNSGRWAPIIGSGGDYRALPAYYQFDLRAERRFMFDRFILDVYADFANVLLTKNVAQLAMEYNPQTGERYVVEQGWWVILPTIGVHGEF